MQDLALQVRESQTRQKQYTSKLQTHPVVREGAAHQETRNCQTETIWSRAPDGYIGRANNF
jgi:hypothetical protein